MCSSLRRLCLATLAHSKSWTSTVTITFRPEQTVMLSLCLLVSSILLLFSQAAITDGADGRSMYEVTTALVETRSLAINVRHGFPGRDEKSYASHGLGLPLAAVLPYLAVRPIARLTSLGEHVTEAAVASFVPIITGLLVVALYRLARRLGAGVQVGILTAIGAPTGTYFLAYTKEFFSEPLATLLFVLAIERALARRPAASGISAAAAAVTRPQFFAVTPFLIWRIWRDSGWHAVVKSGVPLAFGLLLALGYNFARFGDPTSFGYPGMGFTTPLLTGAAGLLFHPEKSIFIFAPIVILIPFGLFRVWGTNRTAFWLLTGNLAVTFLIVAKWVGWDGGWTWGPRMLIPGIIPAIVAIAPWAEQHRNRRILVSSLFLLGFLVSAPTLVVSQRAQLINQPPLRGPNVVRQISLVPETLRFTWEHVLEQTPRQDRYEQYVNIWQVRVIRVLGRRGVLPVCVLSLLLVATAVLSARKFHATIQRMSFNNS